MARSHWLVAASLLVAGALVVILMRSKSPDRGEDPAASHPVATSSKGTGKATAAPREERHASKGTGEAPTSATPRPKRPADKTLNALQAVSTKAAATLSEFRKALPSSDVDPAVRKEYEAKMEEAPDARARATLTREFLNHARKASDAAKAARTPEQRLHEMRLLYEIRLPTQLMQARFLGAEKDLVDEAAAIEAQLADLADLAERSGELDDETFTTTFVAIRKSIAELRARPVKP